MKCCLSFCKNSRENHSLTTFSGQQIVTFHEFPSTECHRLSWLVNLGIEESELPENPMVCSLHFLKNDYYLKNGYTELRSNAVPSAVQVCIICLDTERKLYPMEKFNLEEAYANVTGISFLNKMNFALKLCAECAQRLINCNSFRDKSLRAHLLLVDLVKKYEILTTRNLKNINRENNCLTSNLGKKVYQPDHCDLNLIDDKDEKLYDVPVVKDEDDGIFDDNLNSSRNSNSDSNRVLEPKQEKVNCEIKNDVGITNENDDQYQNEDFSYVGVNNFDQDNDMDFSNSDNDSKPADIPKVDEGTLHTKRIKQSSAKRIKSKDPVKRISNKGSLKRLNNKTKVKSNKDRSKAKVKLKNGLVTLKNGRKRAAKTKVGGCKIKPAADEKKLFKKTVLSYEEQLADVQQRKETANYLNARHKCTKCYKGFLDVDAYNGHMIKHTNKYGPFECDICGLHSKSRNNLCRHIVVNHSIRYSCTLCMFVTMHVGTANSHERWHKGSKFKCPECDLEFGIRSSYLSHLRIKHPSDYACTICGFSFIGERGIKLHMNKKHRFEVQNPDGPLCKPCNIRFASEMAYNQHMKVSPKHNVGQKRERNDPLIKTICWRKRPWSGRSKKDDPDAVEGDPVECEQCGIPLKDYWMYTQHFKKAHPDKNRTKYHRPKLLCELCGKVFNNEAQLRYHMPVHSEHKQFKCQVCGKSFGSILNLKSHATMHSETRPSYACDFCGKTFAYQSNKYRHMTIHKGIKFSCDICAKSFNTAPERYIHVQHVHMKVPWPKRNRGPRNKARPLLGQGDIMT